MRSPLTPPQMIVKLPATSALPETAPAPKSPAAKYFERRRRRIRVQLLKRRRRLAAARK